MQILRISIPKILIISLVCFFQSLLLAQTSIIDGRIIEKNRKSPLVGVHIKLTNQADTTDRAITSTDSGGYFRFVNIRGRSFLFEATYIGYGSIRKSIQLDKSAINLGTLVMSQGTIPMNEVVIEGRIPTAVQKGDTTEYDAKAFKMNKDATTEDLVTKMPGVTVENGSVKAQGEDVKQVLVDGRQFFGSDPTLALRNLPSEIVDKVQVFDKLSDQAQFTGFDDGQSKKTMNIITRQDRRRGQFGRFNGGYGTDDRYTASGTFNSFEAVRRMTILGLSNNVNQQNFSMQDLFGVMGGGNQRGGFGGGGMSGGGRRGGGIAGVRIGVGPSGSMGGGMSNFLVGQQNGISTVNSLGLNYADSLLGNLYMNGSYFFNLTNNDNPQLTDRQYTNSPDSITLYDENSKSGKNNFNYRFDFKFEYAIDTSNSLIISPQVYLQNNKSTSSVSAVNLISDTSILSKSLRDNSTQTNGYTTQSHVVFRHKFPTQRRTISVDLGASGNYKNSTGTLNSLDNYFNGQIVNASDTINQKTKVMTDGFTLSSNIMYTEPMWTYGILRASYNASYTKNSSDNKTYNYNSLVNGYVDLNGMLSNVYDNKYIAQSGGLDYGYRNQEFNAMAGLSYQVATLHGEQTFPKAYSLDKRFNSILPNVMAGYEISRRQNIRFFYRASTAAPSISQLQSVVDNSNPLQLSTGNPDLKQSYNHMLLTHLSWMNTESAQNIMLFINVNFAQDYIGNSTIIAQREMVLRDSIVLNRGSQLTIPVNLDGNRSIRTFGTYGFPFDLIKTNINLNAGFNYTRTPGLVNNVLNISNTYTYSPGIVFASNISENVDYTLSYTANFNRTRNTVQTLLDNNYFTHTAGLRLNWIIWEGIVFKSDVSNTLYHGLSAELDQDYVLWNISIGKKLFANDQGELLLTVYDVLNQNKSLNRTVTETYIEDTTTKVLKRYFMLTFTYNLRKFGGEMMRPPLPPFD
jgi:hypothetical protein